MRLKKRARIFMFLFFILLLALSFFILGQTYTLSKKQLQDIDIQSTALKLCENLRYDWKTPIIKQIDDKTSMIIFNVFKKTPYLNGFKINVYYDFNQTKNFTSINKTHMRAYLNTKLYFYVPNKQFFDLQIIPLIRINRSISRLFECNALDFYYEDLIKIK